MYLLLKKITVAAILSCFFIPVFAQEQNMDSSLLNLVNGISSMTEKYAPEKLYIHTDRTSYSIGDTLWLKIYLFDAAFLQPSSQSGIVYIEVAEEDNEVVKRMMVPLRNGLGAGYIALDETLFPAGAYTLRAYTNWMRNFDPTNIFQQSFTINNYSNNEWLVDTKLHSLSKKTNEVKAELDFKRNDDQTLSYRNLQIKLTDGNKVWHRNTFRTDVDGNIAFNFKIPANANKKRLSLVVNDLQEHSVIQEMDIPVLLNRKSEIDLQFMPEGGTLIAGVNNKVAFKAIGENGLGQKVSGVVYDSKRQVVDSFQSSYLGMGHFNFIPKENEKYTAVTDLKDREKSSFPLPSVKNTGPALHIINPLHEDSIEVRTSLVSQSEDEDSIFYLVAQARGIGHVGAKLMLQEKTKTLRISKSLFPSGITRFTLYNATMQPLCQRMVFITNPNDNLSFNLSGKKHYGPREHVKLKLKVLDRKKKPILGSFSIAVTDDNKIHIDSLKRNSLISAILLNSDLKGYIENPGHYFPRRMTKKIWQDLDNLLLSQGWVSYKPDTTSSLQYPAESSFSIKGKVTNILNKPVTTSQVLLMSKKPFLIQESTTDADGAFKFDSLFPVDTSSFMLQARNKKGKSFNVGISVDAFKPPTIAPFSHRIIPWYVNIDTTLSKIVHTEMDDQKIIDKLLGKHVLKEVVVVGKKAISGSKNLNGPGESDFALDQSDMDKEGKSTLGDILREKVEGFRLGGKHLDLYTIHMELVHLIIDGVDLDFFKPKEDSFKDFYRFYLNYLTAEDIKGIEVMHSARYTGRYFQKFLDPMEDPFENAFIEITTYSGNGAFLKKTPGVFLYKPPVAFNTPAHFYSPKYHVKDDQTFPDLRSTIYWNPDLITDKSGEAKISFYTADKPGTYTLIVEGTDMNGHIGSTIEKIKVE